jgi:K+-sensing histidine kinase KdpD
LAIVSAIAEAHGGSVAAGRSPEGGARIEIELPRFTSNGRATHAPEAVSRKAVEPVRG